MKPSWDSKPIAVSGAGACAGAVLRGCGSHNDGLRVRVLQDQPRGNDGPLQGRFVILDVGQNIHSDALFPLLQRETDAREVLRAIRAEHPACVSVVNGRNLTLETDEPVR